MSSTVSTDMRIDLREARKSHPTLDSLLRRMENADDLIYQKILRPVALKNAIAELDATFKGKTTVAQTREFVSTVPLGKEAYGLIFKELKKRGLSDDRADLGAIHLIAYARYWPFE